MIVQLVKTFTLNKVLRHVLADNHSVTDCKLTLLLLSLLGGPERLGLPFDHSTMIAEPATSRPFS